jgi:macrolide-specific efflux system membrane fusion protein
MPEMTAQVFFVTEAARDVLTVPIGALTFAEDAQPGNAAPQMAAGSGPGGMPPAGAMPGGRPGGAGGAMVFNGEMTEEMRQRIRERIAQGGGFPGGGPPPGGFPGGFGRPGNGMSQGAAGAPPARRDATVKVVRADNSTEERKVVIGVSSRIKAEVISGLAEGEKVVAGIVQAESTETEQQAGSNNNFRGPPGGFMPPFMR